MATTTSHAESIDNTSHATRDAFIAAFTELMCTYPIRDITVKEIVAKTHRSRQTFYKYFDSKDDILDAKLETLYGECYDYIKGSSCTTYSDFIHEYFVFWQERQETLRTILEHNPHWLFTQTSHAYMHRLYPLLQAIGNCTVKDTTNASAINCDEYFQCYVFGGLVQVEARWLDHGCKESPEELAALFNTYWMHVASQIQAQRT
ncbi:TetR/AcrR family transcriptional regulator [Alloscardovia theropitheci]|uniref:TetR/AcrR family transcriptional regulator n=1 Tax=Alloscardovia theropitheci TaxID=2496842 RepID=A0A4R0QSF4_9BIFI|nr:TetR/AcrR family transcriptional regulator [Alloscardovia theropitheci]TCD54358.1 TetR/AcrR family transcriptional regulator [Alloscardovia theropitheci]